MGAREPALGLRDRKKIRTRETIRSEAMRLIVANGYAHTTIEQIADAADIAPSTFFLCDRPGGSRHAEGR